MIRTLLKRRFCAAPPTTADRIMRIEEDLIFQHRKNIDRLTAESTRLLVEHSQLQPVSQDTPFLDTGVLKYFGLQRENVRLFKINRDGKEIDNKNKSLNFPSNNYFKLHLLLSKSEEMRNNFSRFYTDRFRIGKLLEIFDYMAGICSYAYAYADGLRARDCTMVTVSADRFQTWQKISINHDLTLAAYPTQVGTSSIEVRVDLGSMINGAEEVIGTTYFVMAARQYPEHQKPYKLPELSFIGEDSVERCALRSELGKRNQQRRKTLERVSVFKMPPTSEESIHLFNLFRAVKNKEIKFDYIFINETKIEKTLLMHKQDRNSHGKVFGGYLMKEAYELGWVCAYMHGNGQNYPEFVQMDDVSFHSPVEIGAICKFVASVTYVQGPLIHVLVEVTKISHGKDEVKATELHCTFVNSSSKQVLPETYDDALKYLEGKRRISSLTVNQ